MYVEYANEFSKQSTFTKDWIQHSGRIRRDLVPAITPEICEKVSSTKDMQCKVDHCASVYQPEVFLMENVELSDTVVEVMGCKEVTSPVLRTDSERGRKLSEDSCVGVNTLTSLQRYKSNLKILNIALSKTKCRLYAQGRKIRQVTKTLLQIKKIAQILKKEQMLTDKGELVLCIAINNILDYVKCKKAAT